MSLIVRRPGTYSLLVDGGRPQSLHVGIPYAGPADNAAWQLGNALVGNHEPTKMIALEVTLQGPILEATARHSLVVMGAAFVIQHRLSGTPTSKMVPVGHVFTVEAGDELTIQGIDSVGLRAYLCVADGFTVQSSMLTNEPIKMSNTLACHETTRRMSHRWVIPEPWPDAAKTGNVRLTTGTHLSKKLKELLLETKFTVRPESNRMGLRLASKTTWPSDGKELVSAPVVPGTLQLPGGGQPILLGVDAQTIGGYPRLGHVIAADLDRVGQLRPSDSLRFSLVTLDEAEQIEQSRQQWLRSWLERIRWSG
jgi:5-oxoprolinase (ATP-hydrolysing) subunit C